MEFAILHVPRVLFHQEQFVFLIHVFTMTHLHLLAAFPVLLLIYWPQQMLLVTIKNASWFVLVALYNRMEYAIAAHSTVWLVCQHHNVLNVHLLHIFIREFAS